MQVNLDLELKTTPLVSNKLQSFPSLGCPSPLLAGGGSGCLAKPNVSPSIRSLLIFSIRLVICGCSITLRASAGVSSTFRRGYLCEAQYLLDRKSTRLNSSHVKIS